MKHFQENKTFIVRRLLDDRPLMLIDATSLREATEKAKQVQFKQVVYLDLKKAS